MQKVVYLDNSATTKPCDAAINNLSFALLDEWGNPSSLHDMGFRAQRLLDGTRKSVAAVIKCREDEIFFVGSGTEANNTAILGAAYARQKRGKRIVTTAIEHPSVLEPMKKLESEGFEVICLKPQKNGVVSVEDLECAIDKNTILVSIMLVNNETGAIQPIRSAAQIIKSVNAPALLHCDGVQAFGKIPINIGDMGVDLFTASAHKIHGPKGIGLLYIKKGVTIRPLILGGGQEKNMRSGTESVPLVYGLKGAVDSLGNIAENQRRQRELWLYAKQRLIDTGLVKVNSNDECLPYILNVSVEGYRSETLLHFLESQGVYVSSGSACAKGEGSYVLKASGLSRERIDSALRISFCKDNTKEDVDALTQAIIQATQKLRRSK